MNEIREGMNKIGDYQLGKLVILNDLINALEGEDDCIADCCVSCHAIKARKYK